MNREGGGKGERWGRGKERGREGRSGIVRGLAPWAGAAHRKVKLHTSHLWCSVCNEGGQTHHSQTR